VSSHRLITKSLTIALAAGALASPVALAGPPLDPITTQMTPQEERQVIASRGQGAPEPVPVPVSHAAPQVRSTHGHTFDLGSAAVGAGIAAGLMAIALGALGAAGRRRVRVAR
jgi:hypothetical protein